MVWTVANWKTSSLATPLKGIVPLPHSQSLSCDPALLVAFTIFCNYLSVCLMIACLPSMSQHPEDCLTQNSHPVRIG